MALSLLTIPSDVTAASDFTPIRNFLAESVSEGVVAGGAVRVLHAGEVVFETGFGYADLDTREPFRPETPALIASISKPLLGTAVFHLAEAGKLDLTAPISTYLPEFESGRLASGESLERAPTMLELLTHTSGLRADNALVQRPWYSPWTQGQPLSAVVDRYVHEYPFRDQPGTRYGYSGIGIDVAARVAEVAAGTPRNDFFRAEVCEPLGLTHTFYRDAESVKRVGPLPTRYFRGKDGRLRPSPQRHLAPPATYSASGGSIISNANDLSTWLLVLRNRGLHNGRPYLASDTVETMFGKPDLGRNAPGGFVVRRTTPDGKPVRYGHTGSTGTNCWIDFEQDTIGIMLTQTLGTDIKRFRIELEKRITACLSAP